MVSLWYFVFLPRIFSRIFFTPKHFSRTEYLCNIYFAIKPLKQVLKSSKNITKSRDVTQPRISTKPGLISGFLRGFRLDVTILYFGPLFQKSALVELCKLKTNIVLQCIRLQAIKWSLAILLNQIMLASG